MKRMKRTHKSIIPTDNSAFYIRITHAGNTTGH